MQTLNIDCAARAEVIFRPVKSPNPKWGRWECWMDCREGQLANGTVGLEPTGDWLAWDSATGQRFGFPAREQAEQFCAINNDHRPTRIVDPWLGESESEWTTTRIRKLLPDDLH